MADPRNRYQEVGLATAPPERLLTMLWDRLLADLTGARDALGHGELLPASAALLHAQEIVFELRATLRVDAWEGGPGLARLYEYVEGRLVTANTRKDPAAVEECIALLEPLRDAFHHAARTALAERSVLVESA